MTPSYVFDLDIFNKRIADIQNALPGIPLVYSIKANPFLLPYLPDWVSRIEVCSPGELEICKELDIAPEKIIYSGLVKEEQDIMDAISYGAGIISAESMRQYELISEAAKKTGRNIKMLLRLTSGNQFGMVKEDIVGIIKENVYKDNPDICGIHYYSGTGKSLKQVEADVCQIDTVISELEDKYGFSCDMLEYGPGIAAEYFAGTDSACEEKDMALLDSVSSALKKLSGRCRLSLEFGRFMAASCGTYETSVTDLKSVDDVDYIIIDGGSHQMKYFGPNAAMKVPPVEQDGNGKERDYMICGSLCTTADVIVRNIKLHEVKIGDILRFKRTGAYSVTEGPLLFLSRRMPEIYIRSKETGIRRIRSAVEAYRINLADSV